MKKLFLQIIGLSILISSYVCDNSRHINLNNVSKNDLPGNYFLAGNPSVGMLEFLKKEGVTIVINLRSDKEMLKLGETGFNEKEVAQKLGFDYIHMPVVGYGTYNPETLFQFARVLSNNSGEVLGHCAGAVHAMYLIMGYFIKCENEPMNEVVDFGKKTKFCQPLEGLQGEDIKLCME